MGTSIDVEVEVEVDVDVEEEEEEEVGGCCCCCCCCCGAVQGDASFSGVCMLTICGLANDASVERNLRLN